VAEVADTIRVIARNGDVVLTMGAGSIGSVPQQLAQASA
jgi:UDP-N-acetylmuramate-alanine ligase